MPQAAVRRQRMDMLKGQPASVLHAGDRGDEHVRLDDARRFPAERKLAGEHLRGPVGAGIVVYHAGLIEGRAQIWVVVPPHVDGASDKNIVAVGVAEA